MVSPLLHKLPEIALEVNVVELPTQNDVAPEIVGIAGNGVTITDTSLEASLVQVPEIILTE